MKLSVATNFDNKLIENISGLNVKEVYGKLTSDFVGGGRSSYMLSDINKLQLINHIDFAKKHNIGFNYLLNASCMANIETTRKGQKKIRRLLDWICEIGVSSTTISNPLLLKIIKKNYPSLKTRISVFCQVDHVDKAKYWEDNGADVICLDSLTVNRDMKALTSIRKSIACELELLVNGNCHMSCPINVTHMNILSHSSKSSDPSNGFVVDYCLLDCTKRKIDRPIGFIKSDWIRPEDIKLYESLGYHQFKLVERSLPTSLMVQRVKAYNNRSYDGNLLDLIQPYGHTLPKNEKKYYKKSIIWFIKYFFHPRKIKLHKLLKIKKLSSKRGMLTSLNSNRPIFIDNKKLNGFLDNILQKECRYLDCQKCNYCEKIANEVIEIDELYKNECQKIYDDIHNDLHSGNMW